MADIKDGYGLPDALPPLRLPSDADLAQQAREITLVRELATLAEWLGKDGRAVDDGENLVTDAWDEALDVLGVQPVRLRVLWQYALTVGWVSIDIPDDGSVHQAFPGEAAEAWASGGDSDTLDAWASAFTAVLSEAICAEAHESDVPEGIDVHAPGAAMALVLFLSRREGLFREEARGLVRDVITGETPPNHAERTWGDWVSVHGDPADVLLAALAEVGAVTLPPTDDGTIHATPLTLREMRNQLVSEGVDIPLLPASADELTAEQLLAMAEGMPAEEFEPEADAWLAAHDPRLLLDLAAQADPARRLTAVSVVARSGRAAERVWEDSIGVPALRPYAKVALASIALGITPLAPSATAGLAPLPESIPPETLPPELRPLPDDMAWLAVDLLSLACCDSDTDPRDIASAFAQAIPVGQETDALDYLWRSPHPDTERVLNHLGRFHPDKKIAKEARRSAHKAANHRDQD